MLLSLIHLPSCSRDSLSSREQSLVGFAVLKGICLRLINILQTLILLISLNGSVPDVLYSPVLRHVLCLSLHQVLAFSLLHFLQVFITIQIALHHVQSLLLGESLVITLREEFLHLLAHLLLFRDTLCSIKALASHLQRSHAIIHFCTLQCLHTADGSLNLSLSINTIALAALIGHHHALHVTAQDKVLEVTLSLPWRETLARWEEEIHRLELLVLLTRNQERCPVQSILVKQSDILAILALNFLIRMTGLEIAQIVYIVQGHSHHRVSLTYHSLYHRSREL